MHRPDEGEILLTAAWWCSRARRRQSPPGSAWCTSTSCSPTTSRCSRTSSWVPRSCTASAATPGAGSWRSPTPTRWAWSPTPWSRTSASAPPARRDRQGAYRGATTLILDEPTAVLVPQEVDELFGNLAELKREGPHRHLHLAQARRGAQGRRLDHRDPARHHGGHGRPGHHDGQAARRDDGRRRAADPRDPRLHRPRHPGARAARRDRRRPGRRPAVDDVTITVREGEVVGIAGVEGNGQAELVDAIMGLRPLAAGTIVLGSDDITTWTTRTRRERGIGFIPRTATARACCSTPRSGRTGCSATRPRRPTPRACSSTARRPRRHRADHARVRRPGPGPRHLAVALSVATAEAHRRPRDERRPRLLIAAHPTRGVDVGAQSVYLGAAQGRPSRRDGDRADLGDLDELIGLSDTLQVMLRGGGGGHARPARGHPRAARRVHDRRGGRAAAAGAR